VKNRLKRKSENWRQRLPQPIVIRGGKTLTTLGECRDYAVNLDEGEAGQPHWQHAAKLMIDAATGGSLNEVVLQFERILLPQNKLVLS
jgi:hypothetical protein